MWADPQASCNSVYGNGAGLCRRSHLTASVPESSTSFSRKGHSRGRRLGLLIMALLVNREYEGVFVGRSSFREEVLV